MYYPRRFRGLETVLENKWTFPTHGVIQKFIAKPSLIGSKNIDIISDPAIKPLCYPQIILYVYKHKWDNLLQYP